MIFYFSGTGNSKWVAKQIASHYNETLINIAEEMVNGNNLLLYELLEGERVGFVFPVYSWAPSQIVLDFIKRMKLNTLENPYVYFIATCGDDIGLTRNIIANALKKKGWECSLGYSIIMPNTYVLLTGFDTDSKELENKKLKEAVDAIEEIKRIFDAEPYPKNIYKCKEGAFPYLKSSIINPLFNRFAITSKPFYSTDTCISCGKCVKACPTKNVVLADDRPSWGANCLSCLACYHVCPNHSVQYGKATKKKGQYLHPDYYMVD